MSDITAPDIKKLRKDSLERLLHEYFQMRAKPLYDANPWLFYTLESALISLAGGIFLIKGKDMHAEPANHFLALVGFSGRGKNWAFNVFEDLADGIFSPLPFGSGQAFLEALQEAVSKEQGKHGVARGYAFFDEASLISRNLQGWAGDLADFLNQLWGGGRLVWRTRSRQKPNIEIPGKSYVISLFLATTVQRWSVLESKLGEGGWTRRFLVLKVDAEIPYIQEEQPDFDYAFKLAELRARIHLALRALRYYVFRISFNNLSDAKANKKIADLPLSDLRKVAVGDYTLKLLASRVLASAIDVPQPSEFKTYNDAISWIKEHLLENLQNLGIEAKETPDWLSSAVGVTLDQELKPYQDFVLRVPVSSTEESVLSPKEAQSRAKQLSLSALMDPKNFDLAMTFVTASLADSLEIASESLAHIIFKLKELVAMGKVILSRKEFARLVLAKGDPSKYNPTIQLLADAGYVRLITPDGARVFNISEAPKVLVIIDPQAKICGNCAFFGIPGKCPRTTAVSMGVTGVIKTPNVREGGCELWEERD